MYYRENLINHKRIVIKIGTTSLTYPNGQMNLQKFEKLAWVITDLLNQDKEIILVSSGAIAVGAQKLALSERPRDTIGKQASSAVGQAILMQMYENFFMHYNRSVAQILVTMDVFSNPYKKRNVKNTLNRLLEMGVVPIVNENDTVATDELYEFSDNDTLSAYVANVIDADVLIILSDIDAMYTADPNIDPSAHRISTIHEIDEEIIKLAGGSSSKLGTGGMATKVKAAQTVNSNGADMVIASGDDPKIIFDILNGEDIGTLFTVSDVPEQPQSN